MQLSDDVISNKKSREHKAVQWQVGIPVQVTPSDWTDYTPIIDCGMVSTDILEVTPIRQQPQLTAARSTSTRDLAILLSGPHLKEAALHAFSTAAIRGGCTAARCW